jgi:hypothetical protein
MARSESDPDGSQNAGDQLASQGWIAHHFKASRVTRSGETAQSRDLLQREPEWGGQFTGPGWISHLPRRTERGGGKARWAKPKPNRHPDSGGSEMARLLASPGWIAHHTEPGQGKASEGQRGQGPVVRPTPPRAQMGWSARRSRLDRASPKKPSHTTSCHATPSHTELGQARRNRAKPGRSTRGPIARLTPAEAKEGWAARGSGLNRASPQLSQADQGRAKASQARAQSRPRLRREP